MTQKTGRQDSMESFEALLDAQFSGYRKGFDPGEKVTGTVVHIGADSVLVDLNARCEGVIPRGELQDAGGSLRVAVGDRVTACFVAMRDGAFVLSTALSAAAAAQGLREAAERGLPVEGLVKAEINGGYEVEVEGQRGFCPYSQIDLRRGEPADYLGARLPFLVTELDEDGRNPVLSRRELLERQRAEEREGLKQSLAEGDLREGVVARIADFGVFVDLGGIDGLVPAHELSWERDVKPEAVVKVGDRLTVRVQRLDWEQNRVSLSLRAAGGNPWDGAAVRYPPGTLLRVRVTRLAAFGAFAELEPGIEGLIHISHLGGGRRIQHAREAAAEGDELDVRVESVDVEQRRVALKPADERLRELAAANRIEPGARLKGIVDGHRDFGVFVRLTEDETGLLHVSELSLPRGGNPLARLERTYPHGSELDVVVKSIDGKRISLTLPAAWEERQAREQADPGAYMGGSAAGSGLGSLGDAFRGLDLKPRK